MDFFYVTRIPHTLAVSMRRKEKPGNKTKAFFNGKKRLVFEVGLLYRSYCLSQERNRFY